MSLGKRFKRALGAPKRHFMDIKVKSFAVGYSVVAKQFDGMMDRALQAASELELNYCTASSKRFLGGKARDFFPGKALRHLYSVDELSEAQKFKCGLAALSLRVDSKRYLKRDAAWLRGEFVPFLERCKGGDLRRLQHGFKFDEGVPFGEDEDKGQDRADKEDQEGTAAIEAW